ADGLRRIPADVIDAATLVAAGPWRILFEIRVPLAMPALVSGLRVAAPLAPLGAVIGEWVGASAGLGFVMVQANAACRPTPSSPPWRCWPRWRWRFAPPSMASPRASRHGRTKNDPFPPSQ